MNKSSFEALVIKTADVKYVLTISAKRSSMLPSISIIKDLYRGPRCLQEVFYKCKRVAPLSGLIFLPFPPHMNSNLHMPATIFSPFYMQNISHDK